jgi:chromosome segregation ATPase
MDLSWVLQTATMIGIGIIGYFLKTTMNKLEDDIKNNEDRVEKLEKEMNNLKSDLPFIYVTREDFIRAMNNVDKKLDKIYDGMVKGGKQ